ncbi:hypothetical protein TNCV_2284781 [Trichonephila clavipes]|nr:hypothetical protein TNCV_2284781 [Trichonephila clavipes]
MDQWATTLFTDVFQFSLISGFRNTLIRREPGTANNARKIDHYDKGGLMIWAGITLKGGTLGLCTRVANTLGSALAVIPKLKPGKDPTRAENFHPIALLSILGKVAEKIILKRLYHHQDSNNLLIPEQHGFRPDLPPTLESGGNDKVGIRKTKIDWCSFPRYSKSLRPSMVRRLPLQTN